jgi:hypothetical protein
MKTKLNIQSILNTIATSIAIIMATHYFLSYLSLSRHLELFDINVSSVITVNDVLFTGIPFAQIFYYFYIFYALLIIASILYISCLFDIGISQEVVNCIKKYIITNEKYRRLFSIIFKLLFVISSFILLSYPKCSIAIGIFIFLIIGLSILIPHKRKILIMGYCVVIFLWAIKWINNYYNELGKYPINNEKISFVYEGEIPEVVETSKDYQLVFQGEKTVILYDRVKKIIRRFETNKMNNFYYYLTEEKE